MTISNLTKMAESYPKGKKTLWEKEQFLLFPQCFQKACFPGASKGVIVWEWVNSFQNNILHWSKLKAFEDEKFSIAKMMISLCHRAENIVGKGKSTGYQHFLLFPQYFQDFSLSGSFKVEIV